MSYRKYEPQVTYADNTTAGIDVTGLNPQLQYMLTHLGRRGSSTGITDDVMVGINTAYGSSDFATGSRKGVLMYGESMVVGPGVTSLNLRTETTGNEVDVMVSPLPAR